MSSKPYLFLHRFRPQKALYEETKGESESTLDITADNVINQSDDKWPSGMNSAESALNRSEDLWVLNLGLTPSERQILENGNMCLK